HLGEGTLYVNPFHGHKASLLEPLQGQHRCIYAIEGFRRTVFSFHSIVVRVLLKASLTYTWILYVFARNQSMVLKSFAITLQYRFILASNAFQLAMLTFNSRLHLSYGSVDIIIHYNLIIGVHHLNSLFRFFEASYHSVICYGPPVNNAIFQFLQTWWKQ